MKRGSLLAAVPVLLLGLALAAACRHGEKQRQTKNAAIMAQVKTKLAADVGAAAVKAVEVKVSDGVVTLTGPVASDDEKQLAEIAAWDVDGVTDVNNALRIMPVASAPANARMPTASPVP